MLIGTRRLFKPLVVVKLCTVVAVMPPSHPLVRPPYPAFYLAVVTVMPPSCLLVRPPEFYLAVVAVMPPSHALVEISQQYIWGRYCDSNHSALEFSVVSSTSSLISLSLFFFIIMDTTNNSIVLSLAELAVMECLFSHMRPVGEVTVPQTSLTSPSTSQPPQPTLHYSAPPLSTQLPPTLQHSTLITHAPAPGPAPGPSIHQSQLHSTPITQAATHPQPSQSSSLRTTPITELYLSS